MVRPLVQRLNDLKLRDKMLISFLLFMVVPQLILGTLVVTELRRATLSEALSQAEAGVGRLQRQSLEVLGVGDKLARRLAVDNRLESLVTTRYGSTLDVFRAYHGFDTFRLFQDVTPEVASIQVYSDNPTLLDNWQVRPLSNEVRRTFWYQAAEAHPNRPGWFSWTDETKAPSSHLSLVRQLTYPQADQNALLVIDLDTARLDALLGQEGFETLVLDPNFMVVASNRPDLAGRRLEDKRLLTLVTWGPAEMTRRTFQGQESWVFVRDLAPEASFNGLKIVGVVDPHVILRDADNLSAWGLGLMGLGTLLSLVFLWAAYTLFARRLESLSRQLPLVAAGDFDQVVAVEGKDEIGQLAGRFNDMVRDIRQLMGEVRTSHDAQNSLERAQGEIRLKMLASQINPHFLFNVLESIRMKAHLKGEPEIANTVKLLGRLMRRNLEASGRLVALREELENVRCYLEIEKFRLEEKLRYCLQAGPGTEDLLVPPLIIEPLVENAVVHGLERRYGGGSVQVTVQRFGDEVEVRVEDDGLGIPEALKAELLSRPDGPRVGLNNIHQRLRLTYGEAAGLVLESTEGKGTTVRFRIPAGGLS